MEFGHTEIEEEKVEPAPMASSKSKKQQSFIPAEVLSFVGFGTDFINGYYKFMVGKHSAIVDELIHENQILNSVDLCGFSDREIKRYLLMIVSS
jgi:hypothetical protein